MPLYFSKNIESPTDVHLWTTVGNKWQAESTHLHPKKGQDDLPYLLNVMTGKQKAIFYMLVCIWLASLALMIAWWLKADHVIGWMRYVVNSVLLLYMLGLPGYLLFFISKMKRVNPDIDIPSSWRVAMITTRAPSEPFAIVQKTLEAMLAQTHPHDTWLADEDPDEEILEWCKAHDVNVSCRKGIAAYHRSEWPRRTKCKEGNLAYFYDRYGYKHYDFVVQMDADHVPTEGYLEGMLRPFVNDTIGYVSAPSICDSNEKMSWAARGRLYAEGIMHGPLQAGYSDGFAPLCIGSHYAVRTCALKEIGGLGKELAEDHSTTLMMNGHGWRGIHAMDAIAEGEGPSTLADCITQEFQWSRSLMVLLLTEMPLHWRQLPVKLKMQFLFSELWYPIFGLFMLLGHLLPIIAILTKQPWVNVSYLEFISYSIPLNCAILGIVWFMKQNGWLRPDSVPVISWEMILFQIIRWPWVLYGSWMGIVMTIRKKQVTFKVTPKGIDPEPSMEWSILYPYMWIMILTFIPGLIHADAAEASGYFYFLILNLITYFIVLLSIIVIHRNEAIRQKRKN